MRSIIASISNPTIIKVKNALNQTVVTFTRSMQFVGGIVVTSVGNGQAKISAGGGGGGGGAWDVLGNAGANFQLGTTTNNSWKIIQNNLERAGINVQGNFYLKNHQNYTDSNKVFSTGAITTTDAVPTLIKSFLIPDLKAGKLTFTVHGRKNDGTERAVIERSFLFFREGGNVQISSKVQADFTDKTQDAYSYQIVGTATTIEIYVIGKNLETLYWSGNFEYQMIGTNL